MASKKDRFARTYHSVERVEFVKTLGCIVRGCTRRVIHNAHSGKGGGVSFKGPYTEIFPICDIHHSLLHDRGKSYFASVTGVHSEDIATEAVWTEQRWRRHLHDQPQPTYYT